MSFTSSAAQAISRLRNLYNGDAYGPSNLGGMDNDGHRVNFIPALRDLAQVAQETAPMCDQAATDAGTASAAATTATTAASQAQGYANTASQTAAGNAVLTVGQTLTATQRQTVRQNLKLQGAGIVGVSANKTLSFTDVGTTQIVNANGVTVTMGPGNNVENGATIEIVSIVSGPTIVQGSGGTEAFGGYALGSSITLGRNQSIVMKSNGTNWYPVGVPSSINQTPVVDRAQSLTVAEKTQLLANMGVVMGTAQCLLQFVSSTAIGLFPSDEGNQIFINGSFYTIPAAGVALAPSGTVGTIYGVYATPNGSSVSLSLNAAQPVRSAYGYWVLSGNENMRHVGDVQIQSGTTFADYFVVSRYNSAEREKVTPSTSASFSSTTAAIPSINYNNSMLVRSGERIVVEFVGTAWSTDSAQGSSAIIRPILTANNQSQVQGPDNITAPSAVGGPVSVYGKIVRVATSTQVVQGSIVASSSVAGTVCNVSGTVTVRTRQ